MLAVRTTLHDAAPVHAPLQPVKVEFVPGAAVSVTEVPLLKGAEQVLPQLIPGGMLATVPLPVPARLTVSTRGVEVVEKVADTMVFELILRMQVCDPLHAPPQLTNMDPELAVAVKVTEVPTGKLPTQVIPQLIPAGLLTTVPLPAA